jgi:arylsulfatase A-like enzyme
MSAYGYSRPTTPFISEWAKSASLFTGLEAASNYTIPTTVSLMTGKRLWTHQSYHSEGYRPVKGDTEILPIILREHGYYNMAFIQNVLASVSRLYPRNSFNKAPNPYKFYVPHNPYEAMDKVLYQLFGDKIKFYNWIIKDDFILLKYLRRSFEDFYPVSVNGAFPHKALNSFLETIDNNPPQPFFAWIHLFPPHLPYLPPKPYIGKFLPSSDLNNALSQFEERIRILRNKKLENAQKPANPIVEAFKARYDEFILYCDKEFEDFITKLNARDLADNTVIILSSDHGEIIRSDYIGHGGQLDEPETNIPLIIKEPNQKKGQIINKPVDQVDIPATILDLAHIPVPSVMEGRSLVPLLHGKKFESRPVFSMYLQENPSRDHHLINKGIVAVWEGEYKLKYYLEKQKSYLFNLKKDPDEQNDLFETEPETGKRLLGMIKEELQLANERISSRK